jgi:hypothetical protein
MVYYIVKLFISAIIIVIVSEVSELNPTIGALIKALPLISVLSIIWVYADTKNIKTISTLSISTFWYVLPTLPMFLILPLLLKYKFNFYISLGVSILVMLIGFIVTSTILKKIGYNL